jgi:hypothetical protein
MFVLTGTSTTHHRNNCRSDEPDWRAPTNTPMAIGKAVFVGAIESGDEVANWTWLLRRDA